MAIFQGGISPMVGPTREGRSEPGRTRFDSPLARIVVFPQKLREKLSLGGAYWDRFGMVLGSVWDNSGVILGVAWG